MEEEGYRHGTPIRANGWQLRRSGGWHRSGGVLTCWVDGGHIQL